MRGLFFSLGLTSRFFLVSCLRLLQFTGKSDVQIRAASASLPWFKPLWKDALRSREGAHGRGRSGGVALVPLTDARLPPVPSAAATPSRTSHLCCASPKALGRVRDVESGPAVKGVIQMVE